MGVQWIEIKGKKILYVDYRGVTKTEDSLKILREAIEIERASAGGLLLLQNYEGTHANEEFVAEIKRLGAEVSDKLAKNAVVGLSGIKKIFLSAYVRFSGEKVLRSFNTEAEAHDWLVL
ncbi:MAG: hypothetical protein A2087_12255 [Spirochaetes bacterium GWD1_61_31]|nr:MAG: hypothetical protein A2Y37_14975 [Spirochaetes bacterium GWB1_60_80]OHD33937.1 MAG: hypothetical protein A2004_09880 [Spirochaetes bacterium GWC1_61_12]OHD35143.1 MAG: hypothetical protein A2087_12255 [Spirochaetes bacterium GWD1_61_31]OHD41344.1 MAG: hypothetical protein A2Y35_12540 [Spirochaetes bacterium GWE1_60_18]OHD61320.1 MAG: hypothetical protein A2Y32_06985 [Spirochaetes bacterium GWF1_60_12]HAP44751.1 hypothetical protein [Spirochaetaceae bacterium]